MGDITDELVPPHDNKNALGPENHCGDPIPAPVNIENLSFYRYGVGTREQDIAGQTRPSDRIPFFYRNPRFPEVIHRTALVLEGLEQPHLSDRDGSGDANGFRRGDHGENLLFAVIGRREEHRLNLRLLVLHGPDHLFGLLLINPLQKSGACELGHVGLPEILPAAPLIQIHFAPFHVSLPFSISPLNPGPL